MRVNKIEAITEAILIEYNLLKSPVDIETIAKNLNIRIEYKDLDDSVSGFLVKKEKENIIGLNKNHANVRRRFTISHELGHFKLHVDTPLFVDNYKGSMMYRRNNNYKNFQIEKEANSFAAALLMPKKLISAEMENFSDFSDYDSKLFELSAIFQVSEQAMDYRLKTLGYYDYGF